MAKAHTSLTIDGDLIDQAKTLNINISGVCNEHLATLIRHHNEDVEGINVKLEKMELEKARKKLTYWQGMVKQSETKIAKWEEIQKEKEETELKEEKERIESAKRCYNCKEVKGELIKMHAFGEKQICNGCFMNSTPGDIKKWMEK